MLENQGPSTRPPADDSDLPEPVTGVVTRYRYVTDVFATPLPEPIPYAGYQLGTRIHAWGTTPRLGGLVDEMTVSTRHPDLAYEGALMDSVDRARRDAAQVWRHHNRTDKASGPAPTPTVDSEAAAIAIDAGFAVTRALTASVAQQLADLADLFPFGRSWFAQAYVAGGVLVFRLHDWPEAQVPSSDAFKGDDLATAEALATGSLLLVELSGDPGWHSRRVFPYVGPEAGATADKFAGLKRVATHWVNETALPAVYELNRQRIMRVLPPAPSFSEALFASCVVLENDELQGTAFAIGNGQFVTCEHCVRKDTVAFRAPKPSETYAVVVRRSNRTVDLAVLEIPGLDLPPLPVGRDEPLGIMTPIAVIGFPNHSPGDRGTFKPGHVTGFRTVSGIQLILTNAGIVVGMSGGPAIGPSGQVVGVAVRGVEHDGAIEGTEKHSIIPISVLKLLEG